MRKSLFAIAALTLAASTFTIKADAMPLGGLGSAADSLGIVEKSQFFYGGRDYCWYPDGWHGPGFYWCGYAYRPGFGWGGPMGWRGWRGGEGRRWRGGDGMRFQGGRGVGGPRMMGPRVGAPGGGGRGGGGGGGGRGVGGPKH